MSFRSCTSSSRRAFALGALLVALACLAVELAGRPRTAFYGGRKLAEKFVRLEELERDGPLDVLVIGASHVDQGFDAGRFGAVAGVRAINLGVQGTDMYFQSILLRDLLLDGRTPKAVLWALRDEVLTRSNINRQYLDSVALRYATGPLAPWSFRLGRHLPQFQRRRLFDWLREASPGLRRLGWESSSGDERAALRAWLEPLDRFGRTELSTLTRQERQSPREREDRGEDEPGDAGGSRFMSQDYSIDLATAQAHVRETLRRLSERGIAVWFFFTPYFESVFARASKHTELVLTGANQPYYDWLNALAAEFDARVVDLRYCAEISGDARYFFDTRHLNAPGSAPLGELMGELYSGRRALPAAWSGAPGPAQVERMLGRFERSELPTFARGARIALERAHLVPGARGPSDALLRVVVTEAGAHRVSLFAPEPVVAGGLYARLGTGPYVRWNGGREPRRTAQVLTVTLAAGEHVLELHALDLERGLEWRELLIERTGD
jgi:hypothetical protein